MILAYYRIVGSNRYEIGPSSLEECVFLSDFILSYWLVPNTWED